MPVDRSQVIYGFALINMKKTIAPYANKNSVGGSLPSNYPNALNHTRQEMIRQFDAFAETVNKASSARDLGPAFGVGGDLSKRNILFENLESQLEKYTHQLTNYAKNGWVPPPGEELMTGDKTVDALVAACIPMDEADKALLEKQKAQKTGADDTVAAASATADKSLFQGIRSHFYFYWSNCLGSAGTNADPNASKNAAVCDWRYDIASMHFNMGVVYMSCAAHLAFLCSAVSYPNCFMHDQSLVNSYTQLSQVTNLEKEAYGHCCTSAYHFEKAGLLMKDIISDSGSTNAGGVSSAGPTESNSPDNGAAATAAPAATPNPIPTDMTTSFLQLMKEVTVAQGQEISVAKAIKAAREDDSISKMTFTSIVPRLMLGAKALFGAAEVLTQKDIVVLKSGFASFVTAVQTKAAVYEALAYSIQGAYMSVPISSSQRIELAIAERERVASGAPATSAASMIGEDAGKNPEDGLWCINKAIDLANPIRERAYKTNCSPAVRTWADFMINKYIGDVTDNIQQLQQMGLPKKPSAGPVTLKSAMVVARVRVPQRNPQVIPK